MQDENYEACGKLTFFPLMIFAPKKLNHTIGEIIFYRNNV